MLTIKSAVLLCCALLGVSSASASASTTQSMVIEKAAEGCGPRRGNPNQRPCGTHFVSCSNDKNPNERQCRIRKPSRHSSFCQRSSSSSCSESNRNHRPRRSSTSSCSEETVRPVVESSCSESSSTSSSSSSSHSHPVKPAQLNVNGGWYKFRFGATGSTVHKSFDFVTVGPAVLRITGLDCSGDAFSVYDNGSLILQTPLVNGDNCHQANTEVSPHNAYDSVNYSHGRINLAPGAHSIKVVVARAPQNHGLGAIRVDSVMAQCPKELNGMKVVNTPVPHSKAAGVCKAIGMQLADLTIYNFLDATTLAFECAGAFSATWVGSYYRNNYGDSGIALYTGAAAPGGSVNIPASLDENLPVLCQVIPEDQKPAPHSSSSDEDCSYANHHHICGECTSSSSSSSSSASCSEEEPPAPEPSCSEEEQSSSSSSSSSSSCSHRHRRRHHRN